VLKNNDFYKLIGGKRTTVFKLIGIQIYAKFLLYMSRTLV